MPQDVAVVFVHGIQAENINFAEQMKSRLLRRLPRNLRRFVQFGAVFWAKIVRDRQRQYLEDAIGSAEIVDSSLRRFVIEGLGDAASYQKTKERRNSAYYEIQNEITNALKSLSERGNSDRPLIFIGHSLGCHIISSYAWDLNKLKQMKEQEVSETGGPLARELLQEINSSPFRRLDTFAGFVTLGSNMPLFTFSLGPNRVHPITQPPRGHRQAAFPGANILQSQAANKARWLNFYSKHDPLGYPLKPLNHEYRDEARLLDIPVRSESIFSVKPRFMSAHHGYWTNTTVLRETAQLIQDIVGTHSVGSTDQ